MMSSPLIHLPRKRSPVILVADGANFTAPQDLNENTLKTYTLPANTMGANGILYITLTAKFTGANAAKTLRLKFGGTTLHTLTFAAAVQSASQMTWEVWNRNATNSQYSALLRNRLGTETDGGAALVDGAANVSTIDTTASAIVLVTGQLANALDQIDVRGFSITLVK